MSNRIVLEIDGSGVYNLVNNSEPATLIGIMECYMDGSEMQP